jgi:hypothetical protein
MLAPSATSSPDYNVKPETLPSPVHPLVKPKKSRKRVNTAEKRSQHNAIERQRRETLNSKFLVLARLLPSLASQRRPSKSSIVNGSISHLTKQREQRLLAAKLLRQICAERDELVIEVNTWRKGSGLPAKEFIPSWTDEMEDIADVENEVFGNFASVGGENGEAEDNEDEDEAPPPPKRMNIEQATALASNFEFTPRNTVTTDPDHQAFYNIANLVPKRASMPNLPLMPTATLNNWNIDYATSGASTTGSLPYSSLADPFTTNDHSSSGSPHNSALTPPTVEGQYLQTPSPSSQSHDGSWASAQQMQQQLYLDQVQQQVQQQQMRRQQQHTAFLPPFNVAAGNQPADTNGVTSHAIAMMHSLVSAGLSNIDAFRFVQQAQQQAQAQQQQQQSEWQNQAWAKMAARASGPLPTEDELTVSRVSTIARSELTCFSKRLLLPSVLDTISG